MPLFDQSDLLQPGEQMFSGYGSTNGELFSATAIAELYNSGPAAGVLSDVDAFDEHNKFLESLSGRAWYNPRKDHNKWKTAYPEGEYDEQREALAEQYPHRRAEIMRSMKDKAAGVRRQTQLDAEHAYETADPRHRGKIQLGGQVGGFLADPYTAAFTIGTMGVGNYAGVGVGLLKNAAKLAALNGGYEIAQMPAVMQWRKESALGNASIDPAWGEMSTAEAGLRVGGAVALTGGLDLGVRGVTRGVQKYLGKVPLTNEKGMVYGYANKERSEIMEVNTPEGKLQVAVPKINNAALKKVMLSENGSDLTSADVDATIKALGGEKDEGLDALGQRVKEQLDTEKTVREATEDLGLDPGSVDRTIAGAHARVADPREPRPPEMELAPPKAKAGSLNKSDTLEGVHNPIGRVFKEEGKDVHSVELKLQDAETDAETYQFKSGTDAAGSNGKLGQTKKWAQKAAGRPIMFEKLDGTRVTADGHQRTELAKRLAAEGQDIPPVAGFVYREADGWTPEEVRAIAAKKNLQEGSAEAVDAARVLREDPTMLDDTIPLSEEKMRQAIDLAKLHDDAFNMVASGGVKPKIGALVGAYMAKEQHRHVGALEQLVAAKPADATEARHMINEMAALPDFVEDQMDMLGVGSVSTPIWAARGKLLGALEKSVLADGKLFGTLSRHVSAIEGAGNKLNQSENTKLALQSLQVREILTKAARVRGPVSDSLTDISADIVRGSKSMADGVREMKKLIGDTLDAEGVQGVVAKHGNPMPDPKYSDVGKNIDSINDDLTAEMFPAGVPEPPVKVKPKAKGKAKPKDTGEVEPKKTPKETEVEQELAEQAKLNETVKALRASKKTLAADDLQKAIDKKKEIAVLKACDLK